MPTSVAFCVYKPFGIEVIQRRSTVKYLLDWNYALEEASPRFLAVLIASVGELLVGGRIVSCPVFLVVCRDGNIAARVLSFSDSG